MEKAAMTIPPSEIPNTIMGKPAAAKKNRNWSQHLKRFCQNTIDALRHTVYAIKSAKCSRYFFGTLENGKPDLCANFWIIVSLIFTLMLHLLLACQLSRNGKFLGYRFYPMYYLVTVIICYVWALPLAFLAFVKWSTDYSRQVDVEQGTPRTVLSLWVLYYIMLSTYIYLPILWVFGISGLQWYVAMFSTVSAASLIMWLQPDIKRSMYYYEVCAVIITIYMSESAFFILYVFDAPFVLPVRATNSTAFRSLFQGQD